MAYGDRYRTKEEMIELFKFYEQDFERQAKQLPDSEIEKKAFYSGKADAYHIAAFELENNMK